MSSQFCFPDKAADERINLFKQRGMSSSVNSFYFFCYSSCFHHRLMLFSWGFILDNTWNIILIGTLILTLQKYLQHINNQHTGHRQSLKANIQCTSKERRKAQYSFILPLHCCGSGYQVNSTLCPKKKKYIVQGKLVLLKCRDVIQDA